MVATAAHSPKLLYPPLFFASSFRFKSHLKLKSSAICARKRERPCWQRVIARRSVRPEEILRRRAFNLYSKDLLSSSRSLPFFARALFQPTCLSEVQFRFYTRLFCGPVTMFNTHGNGNRATRESKQARERKYAFVLRGNTVLRSSSSTNVALLMKFSRAVPASRQVFSYASF